MPFPPARTSEASTPHRLSRPVHEETAWREPDHADQYESASKVIASRWTLAQASDTELGTVTPADRHVIGINLRHTQLSFAVDQRTLFSGRLLPGMMHVVGPGRQCNARFQAAADVLHLQVSQQMLAECHEAARGRAASSPILINDDELSLDPGIERLGQALLSHESTGCPFGRLYTESVSLAIVTRVLSRHSREIAGKPAARKPASLAKWRLDRAIDYIEANLAEPIALADVANTAGLTRMHFAAQFRAATGYRPHEYLLRRRIEHAQDLLKRPDLTLVDAALSVGFQSQAHFSTVFKRLVGETPSRWRQLRLGEMPTRVPDNA